MTSFAFTASLILIGLLAMLLSTISGGGNNVVLVPVLILLFHFAPGSAIGTTFLALAFGSLAATLGFSEKGKIDYRWGLILGFLALPGVVLGSFITSFVGNVLFEVLLGIVIVSLAVLMLIRARLNSISNIPADTSNTSYKVNGKFAFILLLGIGFFVGTFGQAAGLILVPVMQFLGFPLLVTLGTIRFIAMIIGAGGFVTRLSLAQADIESGLALSIGTIAGGLLGVRISLGMEAGKLKCTVAFLILILGLALITEAVL